MQSPSLIPRAKRCEIRENADLLSALRHTFEESKHKTPSAMHKTPSITRKIGKKNATCARTRCIGEAHVDISRQKISRRSGTCKFRDT